MVDKDNILDSKYFYYPLMGTFTFVLIALPYGYIIKCNEVQQQ